MNGKDQKPEAARAGEIEASNTSAGSSATSRSNPTASDGAGAPCHGKKLHPKAQAAYNAAVERVDASIARAIADAIEATL